MKAFAIVSIVVSAISILCDVYTLVREDRSKLFFSLFSLATSIGFLITAVR